MSARGHRAKHRRAVASAHEFIPSSLSGRECGCVNLEFWTGCDELEDSPVHRGFDKDSLAIPQTRDACRMSNPSLFPEHYASDHSRHSVKMDSWADAEDVYHGETCTFEGAGSPIVSRPNA